MTFHFILQLEDDNATLPKTEEIRNLPLPRKSSVSNNGSPVAPQPTHSKSYAAAAASPSPLHQTPVGYPDDVGSGLRNISGSSPSRMNNVTRANGPSEENYYIRKPFAADENDEDADKYKRRSPLLLLARWLRYVRGRKVKLALVCSREYN